MTDNKAPETQVEPQIIVDPQQKEHQYADIMAKIQTIAQNMLALTAEDFKIVEEVLIEQEGLVILVDNKKDIEEVCAHNKNILAKIKDLHGIMTAWNDKMAAKYAPKDAEEVKL